MSPRTINDVLGIVNTTIPAPSYHNNGRCEGIFLGAECMKRHTADAGWQLTMGFKHVGYKLCGHNLSVNKTNVLTILEETDPAVVVVQDKREWECRTAGQQRSNEYRFKNIEVLKEKSDLFKLTVLKDCHQNQEYHRKSAKEMDVHAWITYYHPRIVKYFAPYVREEHLMRTYHTVDRTVVPKYTPKNRRGALLSGAVSKAYPLRKVLYQKRGLIPDLEYLPHPGYHTRGCVTPQFLSKLSSYKVAICTSSQYGYALRKIIEATAAGCIVITDLPVDDVLPYIDDNLVRIDDNLVRVSSDLSRHCVLDILPELISNYDAEKQSHFSLLACQKYDWRVMANNLVQRIEQLRNSYS